MSGATALTIEYKLSTSDTDQLQANDTLSLDLDPSKPQLNALQDAIDQARGQMNERLTAWKEVLGEEEKPKEAAAQKAHDAAKVAADEDEEDEETL